MFVILVFSRGAGVGKIFFYKCENREEGCWGREEGEQDMEQMENSTQEIQVHLKQKIRVAKYRNSKKKQNTLR